MSTTGKIIIIIVAIFFIKIGTLSKLFFSDNKKINSSRISKIKTNYKYSKLEAAEHEMDSYDDKDTKIVGKTIMVKTNYTDWNITYSVLNKNNRTIDIDDYGQITFMFSRFKYSDYDVSTKQEVKSSQNNNNIRFLNFTFGNGDHFSYNYQILSNSKSTGWVETWNTINGVKKQVNIKKITEGYLLKADYNFIADLLIEDNISIYIKYKNNEEETQKINLKEFQEYIAFEKSYLK